MSARLVSTLAFAMVISMTGMFFSSVEVCYFNRSKLRIQ